MIFGSYWVSKVVLCVYCKALLSLTLAEPTILYNIVYCEHEVDCKVPCVHRAQDQSQLRWHVCPFTGTHFNCSEPVNVTVQMDGRGQCHIVVAAKTFGSRAVIEGYHEMVAQQHVIEIDVHGRLRGIDGHAWREGWWRWSVPPSSWRLL